MTKTFLTRTSVEWERGSGDDLRRLHENHGSDRREQRDRGGGGNKPGHLLSSMRFVAFDLEMPLARRADAVW